VLSAYISLKQQMKFTVFLKAFEVYSSLKNEEDGGNKMRKE